MKAPLAITLIAAVVLVVIVGGASVYTVKEGQQTVLTQFGKPVSVETEAGLKFKTPFIQKVHRLEKRLLPWDGEPENMQTRDKKRIFIDVWARWRIVEAKKYFQAVRTEQRGYKILDDLVDSAVRDVVARYNLIEAVRSTSRELLYESEELAKDAADKQVKIEAGRKKLETEIFKVASADLKDRYGMELTDVKIKRIDYNDAVRRTVYERMISERKRIAQLFESEGEEEKNRILGLMKKELDTIEGEMQQKSAEVRGAADAEVIRIAAEAFSKSPEFYKFLRQLEAYKIALSQSTQLILSTDNKFFGLLRGTKGVTTTNRAAGPKK
ncbi:MAG: protease modulator HflC [Planctomycetota bacterium]|jgi:membrane protease subunit HflC